MTIFWIVLGLLVAAVSIGAIWHAWHDPAFYIKIIKKAIVSFLPTFINIFGKRMSPEDEKRWRDDFLRGKDHGLPGQRKRDKGW